MTHVDGLTIDALVTAQMAARTTDHAVSLMDDRSHAVVLVDGTGRVVLVPEEHLYRTAGR